MRRLVIGTALALGLVLPAPPALAADVHVVGATQGLFAATLLGVRLEAGRCGVGVLFEDGAPSGDVACRLLGVGGASITLALPAASATTDGSTTATVSGTAAVRVGALPPLSLPASAVLTEGAGVQLTVGGVSLPMLPVAAGGITIE